MKLKAISACYVHESYIAITCKNNVAPKILFKICFGTSIDINVGRVIGIFHIDNCMMSIYYL